ncbi:MAG: type VI secretion system baseplate subunit TssG [Burkholderiaceae bacterium]|nr:type VI secretion system baseplate subunit TssG [Burkholderiaceae bacterium]
MTQTTIDRLREAPQGFNLFQAISLLESASPESTPVGCSHAQHEHEAVRLSATVSLSFEPSDIRSISSPAPTGEPYVLCTPVLSLAGAGGPLPQPFTELLIERSAKRDHATADFLDIFNHRLLAFLYRSRRKHHVSLNALDASLTSALDAISALGVQSGLRAPDQSAQWLRHAGLLGGAPRSMSGLLALLRDRLGVKVNGTQFCGNWRTLEPDAFSRLDTRAGAKGTRLGHAAVLGHRVWDQGAGLHLHFSHLSLTHLHSLLPGGSNHTLAQWLVRRYVPQDLDASMTLSPAATEVRSSTLGAVNPMRLGWTSWLTGPHCKRSLAPVRLKLTSAARS